MNGITLKTKILSLEPTLVEVANKLGISKQTLDSRLSAADIKTGFVEQLAILYNRPISYFYDDEKKSHEIVMDEIKVDSVVDRLLTVIDEKDKLIREQAETIGQLRERLRRQEQSVEAVDSEGSAHAG